MTDDDLRDGFGDALTDALRARSRPRLAPTVVPSVEHEADRVRSRRRIVAATLAVVIAATGLGVLATRKHGAARVNVAATPSSTTATTIPSSFKPDAAGVADWTWVSANHGWALVRTRCGGTVCMSLRQTIDGGRTWTPVRTPAALDTYAQYDVAATCATHLCVFGVRFATPQIGWMFGPALLQTTDSGRTWTRLVGPDVTDVETSHGVALRITTTGWPTCGGGCTAHVQREQIPNGRWHQVTTPVFANPSLIILGSDAYVLSVPNLAGAGRTELRRSINAAKTWNTMTDPCAIGTGDHITTSASAAPHGVFVVLCSARHQPIAPFVRISTDGAKTFGPAHAVPLNGFGVIRAASAQTLAVGYSATNANVVMVSHDGGVTWQTTLRSPLHANDLVTLGWENAQTARASFNTDTIWTTRDAARGWTHNTITP